MAGRFVKRSPSAPAGFFAVEAAGLHWLADATGRGGVPVPRPLAVHDTRIELPRLRTAAPTPGAAELFGRRLAATHRSGAGWHGCPPTGWDGDGFIGPLPLPHRTTPPVAPGRGGWGPFFARERLAPFARRARDRGALDPAGSAAVDRVCARLEDGDEELTGPPEPVCRLHGDLWSGNVVWAPDGAWLVDPAAHGGHRESDLAMLHLFGLPLLDRVVAGYDEAWPLADGWRRRVGLHQLFPLLVHAALFGAGYGREAAETAAGLV